MNKKYTFHHRNVYFFYISNNKRQNHLIINQTITK